MQLKTKSAQRKEERGRMHLAESMSRLGTETAFEVLAKAKKLEAQGKDIIHLEIGEPDFDTPSNIKEAAKKAIDDGYTHYGPSAGLPELREVIAEEVQKTRGVDCNPDQIVVTPGAKPIMFFCIMACVDPGEEVIYPNPGFPIYESVINFIGAKPVPLPLLEEKEFSFSVDDLRDRVSDRTRMIILNSPQNPTGGVLSKEHIEAVAQISLERDIIVLTDEVYSRILYAGEHESILSIPGMQDKTILLEGFSKTYAMTGWRMGYGAMPETLAEQVAKLMVNSNSCTASFTQIAGIEALTGPQDESEKMVTEFKIRRDAIVEGLNSIEGISCLSPHGAFYVFPNVKEVPMNSEKLQDYLLDDAGVACLSGTSFGEYGDGYLRFSYANSVENIKEALQRMEKATSKL